MHEVTTLLKQEEHHCLNMHIYHLLSNNTHTHNIKNIRNNLKKNTLNKDHNNKEVNTISLVKHSKLLFHAYKYKYKTKK
jgi:hypothetical protein